jgi:hypothetical protein
MKKKTRKPKLKKEAEKMFKESHVLVVLEDMRDDIKLIAEGLSGTNERLDQTNERLGRLEGEFCDFKSENRENFRLVFNHFSTIEDELQDIKSKLEKMDENKIDKKEFDSLKVRVEKLEKILMQKKVKASTAN